jgi:RNA polymerase sigma-70 factor (ECF subfamily)
MAGFSVADGAILAERHEAAVKELQELEFSLESLVREHGRMVFRIAYSVLRNHHDAEDVAQEVFLRLCQQDDAARNQIRDPRAWLAQVTWRVAVARNRRRPVVNLDQGALDLALQQLRDTAPASEAQVAGAEALAMVEALIARLPEKERAALLLSSMEELSNSEIAAVLKASEASVRGRIFRARQMLKQKLNGIMAR